MAVRERKMLRSRWKRRVELNNGTSIEDAEKKEKDSRGVGLGTRKLCSKLCETMS